MSKYKAGDKVVLEVLSIDGDGYYIVGSEHYSWWAAPKILDEVVEPLSSYTEPLEAKIRRQASHITYLEGKVKELKSDLKHGRMIEDDCDPEAKRAAGQEEAWELARKICCTPIDGGFNPRELIEIFGTVPASGIFSLNTYTEAAAKVAEWEHQKNEICVGDIVSINDVNRCGVVICDDFNVVSVITHNGSVIIRAKDKCKKTGRHIDVNTFLKQIS